MQKKIENVDRQWLEKSTRVAQKFTRFPEEKPNPFPDKEKVYPVSHTRHFFSCKGVL